MKILTQPHLHRTCWRVFTGRVWPAGRLMLFSLLVLLPAVARSQSPDVTISTDRQTATVGDPILYTLSLRYDSTLRLVAPVVGKTLGKLDVLGDTTLPESRADDGRRIYRRQLRLSAFDIGKLWIAPLHGEFAAPSGQSVPWHSDSLAITITSVLQAAGPDTVDIHGLKGPYEVPLARWWWWLIGGGLVLAGITWWYLRRRRQIAAAVVVPLVPSWQQALESLQILREQIDPAAQGGRVWYFRLSEILRQYFDDRYGWPSIDETTSQIMERLAAAPFNGDHRARAREFFLLADQVRYARHPAKPGRPEVDWEWVRDFVQSTIPVVIASEAPASLTDKPPSDTTDTAARQEIAR